MVKEARLRMDHSKESEEAFRLLTSAGIHVITVPVGGTIGPELEIGPGYSDTLYGLKAIKSWLQKIKAAR